MKGRPSVRAAVIFAVCVALPADAQRGLSISGTEKIQELPGNQGKRYAVCIGINDYERQDIADLAKARNDARALGQALKDRGQFDVVYVLTDDLSPRDSLYPRLANVRAAFSYLAGLVGPDDLVMFSFSGHGVTGSRDGKGYLLTVDARLDGLEESCLGVEEVLEWIGALGVRKSLLLLDACRDTPPEAGSRSVGGEGGLRAAEYERAEVSAVFYATKTGWKSYEDPETDYGVFTRFVLEGIRGKADYQEGNRDGVVTFRELASYVEGAVVSYAADRQWKQRPYTVIRGESFGDLAISSYRATVDPETRTEVAASRDGGGRGNAELYSNAAGKVYLDGKPAGEIARGQTIPLGDLSAGSHFLEIVHEYGSQRKEVLIRPDRRASLASIWVDKIPPPRIEGGVTFVFVNGAGSGPDYWIGESEVTFGQYARFVEETGYVARGQWNARYRPAYVMYPVFQLTRDDCLAYAAWLSRKVGKAIRLPTLAEWRQAATGRSGGPYPWGAEWNVSYCHNGAADVAGMMPVAGIRGPIQVQYFLKDITVGGATHMAGNVREWCADERKSAEGALVGTVAGGSWLQSRPKSFAAETAGSKPVHTAEDDVGFRLLLED